MTTAPSWQRCTACGTHLTETDPTVRCACGGLLEVQHRFATDTTGWTAEFLTRCCTRPGTIASGVWRYKELVMPSVREAELVSHPEGNTPLLARPRLSAFARVEDLWIKHEGHNPTGSFKDRGMTVGVTQALRIGARAVACASTGNTAAALAAYAAQAGLPALVMVPAGQTALGKLTQTLAYGARTLLVRGDFDTCLRLLEESSARLGVYLLNSINPWRVEGQKTIVFELLQQLDWVAPDWIVLPAGNLGNTAAFGKALLEAHQLGLIARLPRVAAIQAAGAAPFHRGFSEGFATRHTVHAETIATAIKIGDPASWDRGVRTIRETNGVVTSVDDTAILEAKAAIDAAGVGCEPASAASVAGVQRLAGEGVIGKGERVVAVLTGHVLKDPEILVRGHRDQDPPPAWANRPVEIDPTVAAVERAMA